MEKRILIEHVNVFNGHDAALTHDASIVVEGGIVAEILTGEVSREGFDEVVDGGGRTAIPGLIDSHAHIGMSAPHGQFETLRPDEIAVRSVAFARDMVSRGFTTIRDAGGLVYGLKASIDAGIVPGPRIFPSHACISQTCGHADFRTDRSQERHPDGSIMASTMRNGGLVLADGVPEVMRAVRDQLFLGASQIKIMAGGGLSSKFDHLYTTQYTFEELKAAVDCASDYGTYVMAHIYTPRCMQRAAKAGVKSFEHATLMDEETARIIKDNGIWVCTCPQFGSTVKREGMEAPKASGHQIPIEFMQNAERQSTELINRFDIPLVYGTDASDKIDYVAMRQHGDIRLFQKRFGDLKTLRALTGNAGELYKLCTYQHPYPDGEIGRLEAGSYADLLLVDGNPVEDVTLLAEQDNIRFVMKNGVAYKNTL